MLEEFEMLVLRAKYRQRTHAERKDNEETRAIIKWSGDIQIAIAAYAKANGIDVVLQNWVEDSGSTVKVTPEESYRRILYRPAVYLDHALDLSQVISDLLK